MLRRFWAFFIGSIVYGIVRKISSAVESVSYKNKIIFNTVWEDPRLDKEALNITEDDVILSISSAGCNALSFLLENPKHIYLVDRNPCQNALTELKIAAIKHFDYETFWKMFGEGVLPQFSTKYYPKLRPYLSDASKSYWDAKAFYFDGSGLKRSFYWRGTCGTVAWIISWYISLVPGLKHAILSLFDAKSVEEQKVIYEKFVAPKLWNGVITRLIKTEVYLSWTGIPLPQQKLLATTAGSTESVGAWIKAQLDYVCTQLPINENYFWLVYLLGRYTKACSPEYLKEENFAKLKASVGKISISTETVTEFLQRNPKKNKISTFVLLDHMDWMAEKPALLTEEWEAILKNSTKNPKFLWRSAAADANFVLKTTVSNKGKKVPLQDILEVDEDISARLHPQDRVHTYTSMHVATLRAH
jgi:S-adenosylmethionine-diacylglycerol 3-amino-3-carboxypropyl transferase